MKCLGMRVFFVDSKLLFVMAIEFFVWQLRRFGSKMGLSVSRSVFVERYKKTGYEHSINFDKRADLPA